MGHAQEAVEPQADAEPASGVSELSPELDDEGRAVTLRRASKGVEYSGPDGRSTAHLWLRAQLRYSNPFDEDPRAPDDFETPPGSDFAVNRARLKAQGTLLNPRVGFYYEHELAGDPRLLDLRLDLSPREGLRVRIGQHKVLYNRERVDSSGLDGGYAQVGKAWRWHVGEWARPGEVALRYAHVDQRRAPTGDRQTEATLAFNLFFAGHDNKLTFDVSTLALDQAEGPTRRDTRYRLQWDVSF